MDYRPDLNKILTPEDVRREVANLRLRARRLDYSGRPLAAANLRTMAARIEKDHNMITCGYCKETKQESEFPEVVDAYSPACTDCCAELDRITSDVFGQKR